MSRRRQPCVLAAALALAAPLPAAATPGDTLPPLVVVQGAWTTDGHRILRGARGEAMAQHHMLLEASVPGHGGGSRAEWAHLSFVSTGGRGVADAIGDVQGVSSIEAPHLGRVYEAWIQLRLPGRGALLAGLYDLNRDFYVTEAAALFLNGAHGIGPEFGLTGLGGPSIYPATSLALRLQMEVSPGLTLKGAVLDAVPGDPENPEGWGVSLRREEGALVVAEADFAMPTFPVRVALGAWSYTAAFAAVDGQGMARANRGAYFLAEGDVAGCRSGPCLRAFARAGRAARRYNLVASALGAGLVLETSPDGPALGVALATAAPGLTCGHGAERAVEGNLEVIARLPLTSAIQLLPDLQFIRAPGMNHTHAAVMVASVRVAMAF